MKTAWRVLLIIAVVATVVPAGRVTVAGPRPRTISVVGSTTSYLDVRFDKRFSVDEWATKIDFDGSFAGWLMFRRNEPVSVVDNLTGAYVMRDVVPAEGEKPKLFTLGFERRHLPAGMYRLYLLADGPTEIRIPIRHGAKAMALRPEEPTEARASSAELEVNEAGLVNDQKHKPVTVSRNTLIGSVLFFRADPGVTVQDVQACLKESQEGSCEQGGYAGWVVHARQYYEFTLNSVYTPGILKPGSYYSFQKATAFSVARVVGVTLEVELRE